MPKPIASDLQAIDQLFEGGRPSWAVLSAHFQAAKPFTIPTAHFSVVLETGQAFIRTPPAQILQSFARDHGNKLVGEFLAAGKIGHVSKLPGGNLRLLVTTEAVCQLLANETVTLLGNQYSFRDFDILGSRYFLDIFGLGPEISTSTIIFALHRLGCDILYENYREAVASQRLAMSTYRVYFRSTSCPAPLLVSGKIREQLCISGRYYLPRGKGAPLSAERLRMGQRSPYFLPLSVKTPKPQQPPPTLAGPSTSNVPLAKLGTSDPANMTFLRSLGSDTSPASKTPLSTDPSESILDDKGSSPRSPPELSSNSMEDKHIYLAKHSTGPPDGKVPSVKESFSWTFVHPGNKRNRSVDNFKSLVSNAPPRKLTGLATTNYFEVLESIDVEYETIDVSKREEFGMRYHVVPSRIETPASVEVSKEATHFIKKNHTHIAKDERPTRVGEVVNFFLDDIRRATIPTAMDKFLREDIQVSKAERFVRSTCNGDTLVKFASLYPVALHGVLHSSMRNNAAHLADAVEVHVINRVLASSEPSSDTSFITKWSKRIAGKVPTKRPDLFASVSHWWSDSPAMDDLQRATRSLAFF
uniref:AlNc14C80G5247 protein n=1 Tax=Albugo laibachii Nc14 TaxID=890382 RepID=F0WF53_9STRA|nr:AlNc14C80G5247 [Albugo laibachii Nc14]|eukprot:CCA19835.1 AlNc14C80G5247 [Albugo laibachii Nc14]